MEITREHLIIQSQQMYRSPWDQEVEGISKCHCEATVPSLRAQWWLRKVNKNLNMKTRTTLTRTSRSSTGVNAKPCAWYRITPTHQCRMGANCLVNSSAEKDLEVTVGSKLNINQQYRSKDAAQKTRYILGCIRKSAASRIREVILPHYLMFVKTATRVLCWVLVSPVQ